MNMFARVEQAKLVAKECEKISTLEDIRPVPQEIQGAYRGVLKIRRLNQQITVVCRSYRLHSTGSGESRDFTYGSSYILAGDDKEHFLESPEYVTVSYTHLDVYKRQGRPDVSMWCNPIKTKASVDISQHVKSESLAELNCSIEDNGNNIVTADYNKDTGMLNITPLRTGTGYLLSLIHI